MACSRNLNQLLAFFGLVLGAVNRILRGDYWYGIFEKGNVRFFRVAPKKLFVMALFTLGTYWFYWAYRSWSAYAKYSGADISPLLRSLLPPLFLYSLMRKIDSEITSSGRCYAWSPLLLMSGILLVSCGIAGLWVLIPEWLASNSSQLGRWANARKSSEDLALSIWAPALLLLVGISLLCIIQKSVNFCESDTGAQLNSTLSSREKVLIVPGVVFVVAYSLLMALSLLYWSMTRDF